MKTSTSSASVQHSFHVTDSAPNDVELVRRFNGGDESAFTEIVLRHRAKIYTVARSILRNHSDAEEITQDTFVRAHRGLARFRGDSSLATWLHRIATNLGRNLYWSNHRRRRHVTVSFNFPLNESEGGSSTLADVIASDAADPSRAAASGEFAELIELCMEKLTPSQREILILRNVQHRSYEEIGNVAGIGVGTVKSRIARAREKIRAVLPEICPEFAAGGTTAEWFAAPRPPARLAVA